MQTPCSSASDFVGSYSIAKVLEIEKMTQRKVVQRRTMMGAFPALRASHVKPFASASESTGFKLSTEVLSLATKGFSPRLSCVRNSLISARQFSASSGIPQLEVSHSTVASA